LGAKYNYRVTEILIHVRLYTLESDPVGKRYEKMSAYPI
jgi:hypothetical protein